LGGVFDSPNAAHKFRQMAAVFAILYPSAPTGFSGVSLHSQRHAAGKSGKVNGIQYFQWVTERHHIRVFVDKGPTSSSGHFHFPAHLHSRWDVPRPQYSILLACYKSTKGAGSTGQILLVPQMAN
jgi:hypothetical protein